MNKLKRLMIVTALLFISASTFAQVAFGLRGGINSATVTGDVDFVEKENIIGLNIATSLEIPLAGRLAIQPEVQFTQKGYMTRGEFFGIDGSQKTVVTNFDVPVLLKANFGSGTTQGYFIGGPSLEIATKGQVTTTIEGDSETNQINEDNLSEETLGFQIGGGLQFRSYDRTWVVIDLRYASSLRDNYDLDDDEMNANQGLLFTVGLRF